MSYSSIDEVLAYCKHVLGGQPSFNDATTPTADEVQMFLERASAILDAALAAEGIVTPVTQATAKLVCDDWVTARVVERVELTQRGSGYNDGDASRAGAFRNLHAAAAKFAKEMRLGFARLGVPVSCGKVDGLQFTGLSAPSYRIDPNDASLEQPKFFRGQFSVASTNSEEDD